MPWRACHVAGLVAVLAAIAWWVWSGLGAPVHVYDTYMYAVTPPPVANWLEGDLGPDWLRRSALDVDYSPGRLVLFALYLGSALYLGTRLAHALAAPWVATMRSAERALLAFAGFLPLYLVLCGFNRIVSLAMPAKPAALVCLCLTLAAAIAVRIRARRQPRGSIAAWTTGAAVLALAAVLSVQYGFTFVTGDATLRELYATVLAGPYRLGARSYFPLVAYHYDELAFLLPAFYVRTGLPDPVELLAGVWGMQALAKASAFALTYFCARVFGVRRAGALAIATLLFFGTHTFDPTARVYLFDSANPAFYVMHPGRLISSLYIVWTLAVVSAGDRLRGKPALDRRIAVPATLLFGVGLSSVTLNVALGVIALIAVSTALSYLRRSEGLRLSFLAAVLACAALLPLTYQSFAAYASWGGPLLAGGIFAVGVVFVSELAMRRGAPPPPPRWRHPYLALLLAGVLLGFCIGNFPVHLFGARIPSLAQHGVLLPQSAFVGAGAELLTSGIFPLDRWPVGHQYDFPNFAKRYGFPFVLAMVLATLVIGRRVRHTAVTNAVFIGMAFLVAGLFCMDFIKIDRAFPAMSWDYAQQFALRTRLVEGGFYATIAFALMGILSAQDKWVRGIALAAVLAYGLIPVLHPRTSLALQFIANLDYLTGWR
jgi:hypothetical protein